MTTQADGNPLSAPANAQFGIAMFAAGVALVPAMDAIAKFLTDQMHGMQIVWGRYFFTVLILAPIVALTVPRSRWIPPQLGLQIFRGLCLFVATSLFFISLRHLPLADALAIVYISPLITTALSGPLLGEKIGVRRWVAVAIGLVGALMIIRPGLGVVHPASILPVGSGIALSLYIVATRKLSGTASPVVTLFFTGLVGLVASLPAQPAVWVQPSAQMLGWLAAIGVIAVIGHLLVIKGLDHAPASTLAPLGYLEIVSGAILGLVVFGEFPDAWTLCGATIIISAGLYITYRERVRGRGAVGAPRRTDP